MEQVFFTKKVNRNFLFLFFFVLLISSVSALTFEQNKEGFICHGVRKDGAIPTSASCNITINYANGSNLVNFLAMDDLSDQFCYNLTTSHTSLKGTYDYEVTCNDATENETISSSYLVNLGGIEPNQNRTDATTRTIWIFFGLAFATFLSLFWIQKTPFKFSLFLIMIWFILMGINISYISIQDEVVNSSIEGFLSFFLVASYWANYAIFFAIIVIWIITFIVNIMESHKKKLVKEYG